MEYAHNVANAVHLMNVHNAKGIYEVKNLKYSESNEIKVKETGKVSLGT